MFSSSVSVLVLVLSHSANLQFCGRFAILADLHFLSKGENKELDSKGGDKRSKKGKFITKNCVEMSTWTWVIY